MWYEPQDGREALWVVFSYHPPSHLTLWLFVFMLSKKKNAHGTRAERTTALQIEHSTIPPVASGFINLAITLQREANRLYLKLT